MRRLTAACSRLAVAAAALAIAAPAWARQVSVPIELDEPFVRRAFVSQVYTGVGQTAQVWDDGSGCNFLTLDAPEVHIAEGRVHVVSPAKARVGTLVFEKCLTVLDWSGFVEVVEEPELAAGTAVFGFRVVDSNLYGPKHEKQLGSGVIWDWVKDYVHPRLSTVKIDLGGPLKEVRNFLPLVLPAESTERINAMLDSLALADLRTGTGTIAFDLRFDAPVRAEPTPLESPTPEPTLTAEEVLAWESSYQSWDAFLTFVVKHAGGDAKAEELRAELFDVLLSARYELVEALAPTSSHEKDPVRELFVQTWARLAPLMRRIGDDLPAESALNYVGFIAASNALAALDQLGPEVGLEISSDGLRRLARIVAPASIGDPLDYNFDVDPELRQLGGFGPPLETPPANPFVDTSSGIVPRLLHWLVPVAWAEPDARSRLNRWVPTRDELDDYLPLVRDLLKQTAAQALTRRSLDPKFQQIYKWLVPSVAWKESCWRQFIRLGQTIKPITSSVGAVGMMQVNQRVWRGLYDVQGLRGDVQYNASAGSEIALHYLLDYALKKQEHETGGADNAARATYCVYNGGPGAIKRYRNPRASREGRRIDEKFWEIYQTVKAGRELEVASCWGD